DYPAGRRRHRHGQVERSHNEVVPNGGTGKESIASMENAEAVGKFKTCAVDVLQVPAEKVTPDARFGDDLDADSLALVELVMALEESFDITLDESELEGIETVEQAFNLVTSKL